MTLPFDDWLDADGPDQSNQPGGIVSLRWFEVEANGPGKINRLASIAGIVLTQNASPGAGDGAGDGTITLDTGYGLNATLDQWDGLIDAQTAPLASCYVVLSSIGGVTDDVGRSGWLESVDASLQSVGNQLNLFLTIKANLDGDIAFWRIGYQVVLLFNSNRPPAVMPVGINSAALLRRRTQQARQALDRSRSK
ncbi:MAG: hypothetical protein WBS19_09600 [Candidatus Korobacteraceae bacterium]